MQGGGLWWLWLIIIAVVLLFIMFGYFWLHVSERPMSDAPVESTAPSRTTLPPAPVREETAEDTVAPAEVGK
jgi:flagellar basal body-associated protein FliL